MNRALAVLGTGALVAFVLLSAHVASGAADRFDAATADIVYVAISSTWRPLVEAFSRLGQFDSIVVMMLAAMIGCVAGRRWSTALLWFLTLSGGGILNSTLKATAGRARPTHADPQVVAADALSFPSGHTMMTLVVVGFALYLFLRRPRPASSRAVAVVVAVLWCGAMGVSRLLLGSHFVSDVLGGYLAGIAWLAVCVAVSERVLRRSSTIAVPR